MDFTIFVIAVTAMCAGHLWAIHHWSTKAEEYINKIREQRDEIIRLRGLIDLNQITHEGRQPPE